jgi:LuxR family maltose regulon positive regulatory protein
LIIGHVWLAWLRQTEGNTTGSHETIQAALQLVQQYEVSRFWPLPSAACTQARLWIAQGNLAAASRWAQTSGLNQAHSLIPYLDEAAYLMLARLRIAEGSLEIAEALLLRLHQAAASAGRSGSLIEILILQAVTYAAQKQGEQAMAVLAQALSLAEPEGYIRLFVDEGKPVAELLRRMNGSREHRRRKEYIYKLLLVFETNESGINPISSSLHPSSVIFHPLVEPLSVREQEILQLLAEGLSNNQIATRLIITTGTVKTHLNRIFGKLGVESRTQAIARGRATGLIAS